jgi:hypothetical protein
VLTRRVKQGVAEWYVLEILEKSWGGFEMHTEAGFNIGMPCYGYQALRVPHPVPAKRAKGIRKTRLEPHPDQAPVVRKMFAWRAGEQMSYQAIADRLNADLTLNPPPVPVDPERSIGRWTYSNVRDVLTNPKHTGHMVWNRRARKGAGKNRMNPVSEWVWSPEPVHEALVGLEAFVQAQEVPNRRERSRSTAGLNRHPQARRVYPLRSYVFCGLCGRRMFGLTDHKTPYYACAPKKPYRPDGHPAVFRVRQDYLLGGLTRFLAGNVFGPYRHTLLDASQATLARAAAAEHAAQVKALRRAIADTDAKSSRLIRALETADDGCLKHSAWRSATTPQPARPAAPSPCPATRSTRSHAQPGKSWPRPGQAPKPPATGSRTGPSAISRICVVAPEGFEPSHLAPEASGLH